MVSSINSNAAAYAAQINIALASQNVQLSVARLSSGNRIINASDDVAALAIGSSLANNVRTLQVAKLNASLGGSLLQVADGALGAMKDILQTQKNLATQASSGSLSATDRGFLDQEFQVLSTQLDNIARQTNFNGVSLLNGSLSESARVSNVATQASKSSATLTFSVNPSDADTLTIGGIALAAESDPNDVGAAEFLIGGTTAETVNNLAAKLNTMSENATYATTIGQAKYSAVGNTLQITSRTGGALGNNFTVNMLGTAVAAGDASIGGSYGGASSNLFATGFSSATSVVAATTAAAATPFQVGNTITAQLPGGVAQTLHTVAASDTLTTIVNGINASSDSTGFKAAVVYSPTAQTYNIRLSYNDSSKGVTFSAGTNYSAGTYGLNGAAVTGTYQTFLYSSSATAMAADLTVGNITNATTDITAAYGATASASTPFVQGDTLTATVNGKTVNLFTITSASSTLTQIIAGINGNLATTGVFAALGGSGGNFNITLYYNDPSNALTFSPGANADASAAGSGASVHTGPLTQTVRYGLNGGADDGLGMNSVNVAGSVGDNLVTGLAQSHAKVSINFPDIPASSLTSSSNFNSNGSVYITVGGQNFAFTTTAATSKAPNEISIGDTLQETLDNAVTTINKYLADGYAIGTAAYEINQMKITRDGNALVFEGKNLSTVQTIAAGTSTVALSGTFVSGASITNSGTLDNGSNKSGSTFGIDATGVTNAGFTGTLDGFAATYKSANTADFSVKVGNYTYTAHSITTNPTSNTTIRFLSDTLSDGSNGGYFDVQLQANKGATVANQSEADTLASRLDAAFSSLSFLQTRNVSSYHGTQTLVANNAVIGSLLGSKVSAQLASFDGVKVADIRVAAPAGSNVNASISLTIDGEEFETAQTLSGQLGANQTYRLTSKTDATHFIDFTTGNSTIDISTADNAAAAEEGLKAAFGSGDGSAALTFQVGASTADTLSIGIESVTTNSLYGGASLNVLTQASAATAAGTLETALNAITAARAGVGALQAVFNAASATIDVAVQNQDAARGTLLDTDIASESTSFAISQVKLQAGISTLAQANQQLQSLLKLIG